MTRILTLSCLAVLFATGLQAQDAPKWKGKFEQLDQLLPTPNEYRSGSGAPGPKYWQQKADYVINVELHDDNQSVTGSETITYTNNSPDVLKYLWLQLDQNKLADGKPEPLRLRRWLQDQIGKRCKRQSIALPGELHHDAHRPAPSPGTGSEIQLLH
jgi:hypothetical protein